MFKRWVAHVETQNSVGIKAQLPETIEAHLKRDLKGDRLPFDSLGLSLLEGNSNTAGFPCALLARPATNQRSLHVQSFQKLASKQKAYSQENPRKQVLGLANKFWTWTPFWAHGILTQNGWDANGHQTDGTLCKGPRFQPSPRARSGARGPRAETPAHFPKGHRPRSWSTSQSQGSSFQDPSGRLGCW